MSPEYECNELNVFFFLYIMVFYETTFNVCIVYCVYILGSSACLYKVSIVNKMFTEFYLLISVSY